ncbi:MAG: M23 family metallopeptidase, partial [bacterium]
GKALYLRLSDGKIAVFGHLSRFKPEIEEYVAAQQLASESYEQDLYPEQDRFEFARGDTVAWSGSTGVGAPHLHFEIRTADDRPLNPLLQPGFAVRDSRPPVFKRLHLITGIDEKLAAALGLPTEYEFRLDSQSGIYKLDKTLPVGILPFWLSAEVIDLVGSNSWRKPVYSIELRHAGQALYHYSLDTVDFAGNYLIDATRNYQRAMQGDKFFQNLVDDKLLTLANGIGGLISDFSQPLEIVAGDAAGNTSRAQVRLEPGVVGFQPDAQKLSRLIESEGDSTAGIWGAFFPFKDSLLFIFNDTSATGSLYEISDLRGRIGQPLELTPGFYAAYVDHADTSGSSTDQVTVRRTTSTSESQTLGFRTDYDSATPLPEGRLGWSSPDGRFRVSAPPPEQTFFPLDRNSFFLIEERESRESVDYAILPEDFAARKRLTYSYRFDGEPPRGAGLYQVFGKETLSFLGAKPDEPAQTVSASSYRLGVFTMRIDTIPPAITGVSPRDGAHVTTGRPEIKAKLKDTLSGIEDITLRLDGQWLIAEYDPESGWVRATPHFNLSLGKHRLDIIVRDKLGNEQHYKSTFSQVDQAKNR